MINPLNVGNGPPAVFRPGFSTIGGVISHSLSVPEYLHVVGICTASRWLRRAELSRAQPVNTPSNFCSRATSFLRFPR